MADTRVQLARSEALALPAGHTRQLDVSDDHRLVISLRLRRDNPLPPQTPGKFLSRADFEARHGALQSDLRAVREFARAFGLTVLEERPAARMVKVAGTVGQLRSAFGISALYWAQDTNGKSYHTFSGSLSLPTSLQGAVVSVHGFDTREIAQPNYVRFQKHSGRATADASTPVALTVKQVTTLYKFPSGDGTGQNISIIEFGGGVSNADLATFCASAGIGVPSLSIVGTSSPGTDPNADGEVMLDIEVVAGVAPKAKQTVYFASNDDQGWSTVIGSAVHATPRPTAISISWGGSSSIWPASTRSAVDSALHDAAALGITVCIATGDNGSTNGGSAVMPQYPAESPSALACGGTTLVGTGSTITSEVVWNDGPTGGATGGGFSTVYSAPSWQSGIGQGGGQRGIPDVAGDASPNSGYKIVANGTPQVVGGTSAVAPLWAGLIALLAQNLNRNPGFLPPLLYTGNAKSAFRDITVGNNDAKGNVGGKYAAGPGWDACTGLGSPIGTTLVSALKSNVPPPPPKAPPPKAPPPKAPPPKAPPPKAPPPPPKAPPPPPKSPPPKAPPPPPKSPPPPPSGGGTGTTGTTQSFFVPPPVQLYPSYAPPPYLPPAPPLPPPPAVWAPPAQAPATVPPALQAAAGALLSKVSGSPALGVVAVVGLVVLGVVGVVGLSEGGDRRN